MPQGDGTGAMGMGPMTGRRAGFCAGYGAPGFINTMPERGGWEFGRGWRGRGFRMGMGWRHGWAFQGAPVSGQPAYYPQAGELSILKSQADYLADALQSVNSRISELEQKQK